MFSFSNKTVLITGGASGIGRLMGGEVLQRGAKLIIWDISPTAIKETLAGFSRLGTATAYCVDITDLAAVTETAARVQQEHGGVDVLINNAGIVVGNYFHAHTPADITRTMAVNAVAPMQITLAFLPRMLQQNAGHVCNIASSAGLVSNPKMAVYAASKWAMIGWSDSLRLELRQLGKNIGVTTVTPYYINTGMFAGVRSIVPLLKPERVAKQIIRAIERERIFLSMPWSVRFVRFFQGVLPVWLFDWFVGNVLGIYRTMEHFKGRSG